MAAHGTGASHMQGGGPKSNNLSDVDHGASCEKVPAKPQSTLRGNQHKKLFETNTLSDEHEWGIWAVFRQATRRPAHCSSKRETETLWSLQGPLWAKLCNKNTSCAPAVGLGTHRQHMFSLAVSVERPQTLKILHLCIGSTAGRVMTFRHDQLLDKNMDGLVRVNSDLLTCQCQPLDKT
eukprot:5320320-Amphidinium_carterae.1